MISGGPNTHDEDERHVVHHTIGELELYQSAQAFKPVVAKTFVARHLNDIPGMVDDAINLCIRARKPVYLEIACNLYKQHLPLPPPLNFNASSGVCKDDIGFITAVEDILRRLEVAVKPVLVVGNKLRTGRATEEILLLAEALQCGVATMPDAKGLFPENHPQYVSTSWQCWNVSTCYVCVDETYSRML